MSASFDSSLDPPQVSISSHDSPEHLSLIISDEQVQTCSINGFDTMLLNGGGKETLVASQMLSGPAEQGGQGGMFPNILAEFETKSVPSNNLVLLIAHQILRTSSAGSGYALING